MDEKILKWLYDIKMAIDEINGFFDNQEMDFFQYQNNLMLKRAIERDLEIIGEAMNRILKNDSSFENKISNAKAIIGLRNLVIHAYDNISDILPMKREMLLWPSQPETKRIIWQLNKE